MLLRQTSHREQISCLAGFTPLPLPNELWWKASFSFLLPFNPISHSNSPRVPWECCCLMAKLSKTTGLPLGVLENSPPAACPDSWTLQHPNTGNTGHVSIPELTTARQPSLPIQEYSWLSPQRNNYKEKPQPAWKNCTTLIQRGKKIKPHPNI